MLSRYHNIDFVIKLSIEDGFEMLKKANYKQIESTVWDMWLVDYSRMDKETFMSFEDYKNNILKQTEELEKPVKTKTKEEIINQAENIIKAFKKGGNT